VPSSLIVTASASNANSYATLARARTYYDNTPGSADLTVSPIVSSSVAAASVITTLIPHNLGNGDVVVIASHSGSTPSINGTHTVTVLTTTTFTIPVTVTVAGTGGTITDDNRLTRALLTATALIDDKFEFDGDPTTTTQALAWPRLGLTTKTGAELSSTTIPSALEDATAQLAWQLLKDTHLANQNNDLAGVTRIKAGRAFEIEFAEGANLAPTVIPDNVARMLARWGTRIGKTGVLKLVRA
jgi:hypothetical protein